MKSRAHSRAGLSDAEQTRSLLSGKREECSKGSASPEQTNAEGAAFGRNRHIGFKVELAV